MKNILKLPAVLFLSFYLSSCQKEFSIENDLSRPQVAFDTDAQNFISISGITVDAEKTGVNNFVKQLKDSGLWTKFIAIYPMVGGTEGSMKWNLKEPRNVDVAYRLTFNGTPVYANTGVTFPTISDYADTHLADSELTYNDNSISYYARTQNTVDGYDMGCLDHGSPYNEMAIYHTGDASNWFGYYNYGPAPSNTV